MLWDLCLQWLYYSIEDGCDITTPVRGIAGGSALSPLIGGSLLHHMDCHFGGKEECFYARYMDDFIIFTQTRWHLRQSIRRLHDYFELGGFSPHPDKTQVGKKEYGCDWMGGGGTPAGATVAPRGLANHRECCARLDEQARGRRLSREEAEARVRAYVVRWYNWAQRLLAIAAGS